MKNSKLSETLDRFGILSKVSKKSAMYMDSNNELSVFRCKSLLEYNNEKIKLCLVDGVLTVCGCNLFLKTFSNTEITVSGKIYQLNFEEKFNEEN